MSLAAGNGNERVVRLLLEGKADSNLTDQVLSIVWHAPSSSLLSSLSPFDHLCVLQRGLAGLFKATMQGHVEVVVLLLANRADVNAADPVPSCTNSTPHINTHSN